MAFINEMQGLREVLTNIDRRLASLKMGFSRGLRSAGLTLQRESQRLVPVNFGVLKNSAFTRSSGLGYKTVVTVGYTASYAIYVHEAVGMKLKGQPRPKGKGKYWDPQGRAQAKFLEEPFNRLRPQLIELIKESMRSL